MLICKILIIRLMILPYKILNAMTGNLLGFEEAEAPK
jgi:hypothetical protein